MIQSTFRRVEKQYSDIDLKYWLIIRKSYGEAMSFFNLMIHLGEKSVQAVYFNKI